MSWQRRSRSLGSAFQPFPLTAFDGSFFALFAGSADRTPGPISSTEQIPMPYALRNARLTARVSAMRISAPRTHSDTLDGSECVRGAEMRIAETRAVNRALRKAYGIGICSVEEIGPGVRSAEPAKSAKKLPSKAVSGNGWKAEPKLRD